MNMKIRTLYISLALSGILFNPHQVQGQETRALEDVFPIISPSYNLPGSDDTRFQHLNFRFGWTDKAPFQIAVQISNPTYGDQKIKFAVKDLTTSQSVLLDPDHNAYFINETLRPNSEGNIWSGEVKSLSDEFALKVWDANGDSFQKDPITILNEWTDPTRFLKSRHSKKPGATPTPKGDRPAESVGRTTQPMAPDNITPPGNTATPTLTLTATPCQTPAPFFKCALSLLGDSYTGYGGTSPDDKSYRSLTIQTMQRWYPGVECNIGTEFIREGAEPGSWANEIGLRLDQLIQNNKNLPIAYMVFQTGNSCFYYAPDPGHDGCKGASVSQGVSISYIYKENMDKVIRTLYSKLPNVHLVVLDIADTSGGAGHFAPPEVYEAYRQRLFELKTKYPRMRIADIYKAIGDHSEYFNHNPTLDKEHPNEAGFAIYARCVLDQFANWPFKP